MLGITAYTPIAVSPPRKEYESKERKKEKEKREKESREIKIDLKKKTVERATRDGGEE